MDILIKVARRDYERLRAEVPPDSPAHDAIYRATPIDHSIEGVQFEGYNIPCDENQARIFLDIAKNCCPEIIRDIEKAITLATSK
jgi:hypothetical protein